jgi:polyisoprenoid-binding protein YceI
MKKGPIIASVVALLALGIFVKIQISQPPEDIESAMMPAAGSQSSDPVATNTAPADMPAENEAPQGDPVVYTVVTDDSSVEFTGYKIGGHQNCTFFEFGGTIKVIGNDPATAEIDMSVDLESIIHDNQTFVNVMLGEAFFDIENHPTATFKSSSVQKDGDHYKVTGDLTLRGIPKTISFSAKIESSEDQASFNAEFKVNRQAWGITYEGKKDALIKDEVVIKVALVAQAEKSDG